VFENTLNRTAAGGMFMKNQTRKIALLGLFTALIIILQLAGSFIKFGPFSVTLVLIPLAIGAILEGPKAGAYLGGIFGLAVFLSGDAALFYAVNIPATIALVMLKGVLAGLVAGWVYKLLQKHSSTAASIAAAVVCPVVNTGVFLLGCLTFFRPTMERWALAVPEAVEKGFVKYVQVFNEAGQLVEVPQVNILLFLIVGVIGLNFVFELLVNLVLSPVIVRIVEMGKKKFS